MELFANGPQHFLLTPRSKEDSSVSADVPAKLDTPDLSAENHGQLEGSGDDETVAVPTFQHFLHLLHGVQSLGERFATLDKVVPQKADLETVEFGLREIDAAMSRKIDMHTLEYCIAEVNTAIEQKVDSTSVDGKLREVQVTLGQKADLASTEHQVLEIRSVLERKADKDTTEQCLGAVAAAISRKADQDIMENRLTEVSEQISAGITRRLADLSAAQERFGLEVAGHAQAAAEELTRSTAADLHAILVEKADLATLDCRFCEVDASLGHKADLANTERQFLNVCGILERKADSATTEQCLHTVTAAISRKADHDNMEMRLSEVSEQMSAGMVQRMAELSSAQERFCLDAAGHAQAAAEELARSTAVGLGKRLENFSEQLLQRQERVEARFESRLGEIEASIKCERESMASKLSELSTRTSEVLESRLQRWRSEADSKMAAAAELQEQRLGGIERLKQIVIEVASTQRSDSASLQASLDNRERNLSELASKMASFSEGSRSSAQRLQELEFRLGRDVGEAAQFRDDCAIMQQRLGELRDAFHHKAAQISDLEARLPSPSSLSEVARLEQRFDHTVSRQYFQQVVADLTSKLETRVEGNRWSAFDNRIAARTTDKLDAIAIDDRINANVEIRRLKETVASLAKRTQDSQGGNWLREPTTARGEQRLEAMLTDDRMNADTEFRRLKTRVEELTGRLEDVVQRKEPRRSEGCSEGELRLQETVSSLAKRVQEILAKVDSKADAMDVVSSTVLEQRLRPLAGRLDQKLDTAVHEQELSQLERKLGQLEQRLHHGKDRGRVKGIDDNEVSELQEAVSALDRELKDGLTSCRKKVSILERKMEDKIDNDSVAPLLSSASDRMKELVALMRH